MSQYFSNKKIWQAVNRYYTIVLSERRYEWQNATVEEHGEHIKVYPDTPKEVENDRSSGKNDNESER